MSIIYSFVSDEFYSSALGIPVTMPDTGFSTYDNATFTMETSFLSVNCSNNTLHHDGAFSTTTLDPSLFNSASNGTLKNGTYYAIKNNGTFSLAMNGFYQQNPYGSVWDLLNDNSTYEPLTLLFQSQVNATGGADITSAYCQLTTSYWESEVWCAIGSIGTNTCQVNALRPSQLPHPNSNLTDLGFIGTFTSFSNALAAASVVPAGTSSVFEMYLNEPSAPTQAGIAAADVSVADPIILAGGLQSLLNTYFYGSYNPPMFMNGGEGFNGTSAIPRNRTTPAVMSMWTLEYQCDPAWLLVYFLASLVMLASAIIGTILNHKSNAPETLGFCSTIVKDNPYIRGSDVGSGMSGFARTKAFRDLRLKLVDVDSENERGYIAIIQDDGRYANLPRKSARLYR
jgi:hypothetical protein